MSKTVNDIVFRVAGASDWEVVKELRLKALKSDPEAFTSTYEDKVAKSDEYWRNQVIEPLFESDHEWLIGYSNGVPIAIGGGAMVDDSWSLYGVWVAPEYRGTAVSKMLFAALEVSAILRGLKKVVLLVEPENDRARKAYAKAGYVVGKSFVPTFEQKKEFAGLVFMSKVL